MKDQAEKLRLKMLESQSALNVLQYVGVAEKYQHVKGDGVIDCDGIDTPAEVHWFQEESVGRVEFKVKKWKKL